MTHIRQLQGEGIVIKIGTESLFQGENGEFGGKKIETLCSDIAHIIHKTSDNVVLISSGAVGFGKQITGDVHDDIVSKQYLATIGHMSLMTVWNKYFLKHHIITGGLLVTHADIEDDETREKSLWKVLGHHFIKRTLPIINENDAISSEEMQALGRGADNDKNALLIAKLIKAKMLYVITNTNGVYGNKNNPHSRIQTLHYEDLTDVFIEKITGGKSEKGTGGMYSKLKVAREASEYGIETRIIDGVHSTIGNFHHRKDYAGTTILART